MTIQSASTFEQLARYLGLHPKAGRADVELMVERQRHELEARLEVEIQV